MSGQPDGRGWLRGLITTVASRIRREILGEASGRGIPLSGRACLTCENMSICLIPLCGKNLREPE